MLNFILEQTMNTLRILSICALPLIASISHANTTEINACVVQITDKNITDKQSAQKVCGCVVKEQAKITQAQKDELDSWVRQGKDIRANKTFQTISNRMKACGDGVKFNK